MKVQNKNFYFDIGQNNRGIYMRISEVSFSKHCICSKTKFNNRKKKKSFPPLARSVKKKKKTGKKQFSYCNNRAGKLLEPIS